MSARLLLLDAAVLLAMSLFRGAVAAAEAAGGPAALWGLTQPITVDPTHLAHALQYAAAFCAAWSASAIAHGCADADAVDGPPAAAATRAGHAAAVAAPAALLLFLAVSGRGMAAADLAASLVVPPAIIAAWRGYISDPYAE